MSDVATSHEGVKRVNWSDKGWIGFSRLPHFEITSGVIQTPIKTTGTLVHEDQWP